MSQESIPAPPVVSRDEWRAARVKLLDLEKELTRQKDRVNAQRRRLPMVRVEKQYSFETPTGKQSLGDLFEGRRQLIVYHFMFDPEWEKGCSGCTGFVDALGDLSMLSERDTTFVLISRAPLAKLQKYATEKGWDHTWVSSHESDFNYDFHATLDAAVAPVEYNYLSQAELEEKFGHEMSVGESHALSVFFKVDDDVFHTYQCFARGVESLTDSYQLLDCTPYGRQEDFEDSPPGWPQRPTYR